MKATERWFRFLAVCMAFVMTLGFGGIPTAAAEEPTENETGSTYYVDADAGNDENSGLSEAEAWKSLDKVNETTFQPGDRILFKSGCTWYGQLYPKGSGQEGAPIMIGRYGDEESMPKIDGQGEFECAVKLCNQEYWEIHNLEVTNWNDEIGQYAGIRITAYEESRAYNHIVIKDCYVHDVHGERNFDAQSEWHKGNGGIIIQTEDHRAEGIGEGRTWYNDILIEGNRIENVSETGIRVAQSTRLDAYYNTSDAWLPMTNVVVRGNILMGGLEWSDFAMLITPMMEPLVEYNIAHDWRTSGLECTNTVGGVFQYNEVYDIHHWESTGTADECAFDADMNSSGVVFQYNYAHDVGDAFLACSSNASKEPSIFRYNIAVNVSNRLMYGPGPGVFYNNVFYSPEGDNAAATGNMAVRNNIIWTKTLTSGSNMLGNLYWGGAQAPSCDTEAVTADPMFVDPGKGGIGTEIGKPMLDTLDGYQLQPESPAIDRGIQIEDNGGRDYWGNQLYVDAPDIGAHEYSAEDKPKDQVDGIVVPSRLYVKEGESVALDARIIGEDIRNETLLYSSADETVASVSSQGMIKGEKAGTTVITVTSEADPDASAQCTVIVYEQPGEQRLGVTQDAYVRFGGNSGNNYHDETNRVNLEVQTNLNQGWLKKALLEFDLSDVKIEPDQSVVLRLYANTIDSDASRTLTLNETETGWKDSEVTGTTVPDIIQEICTFTVENPEPGSVYRQGKWIEVDLTEYMKERGTDAPLSLMIANDAPGTEPDKTSVIFNSKEAAENQPYILIRSASDLTADPVSVKTHIGELPVLPEQISCVDGEGAEILCAVQWEELSAEDYKEPGVTEVMGYINGDIPVICTVEILAQITFDLNYDTAEELPVQDAAYGEIIGEFPKAEREGWKLLGWNTEKDGSGEAYTPEMVYTLKNDLILYAEWQQREDVESVELESRRIYLKPGESRKLEVSVLPETIENREVEYISSDDEIVSVDEQGDVTGLQEGTAVITVTSTEAPDKQAQCEVIVRKQVLDDTNASSVIIYPAEDAFVKNGGAASTNQHTGEAIDYLWVRCSDPGYARRTYIEFDLSEYDLSGVDQASLMFYTYLAGSKTEEQEIGLWQTGTGWKEDEITYNNAPDFQELIDTYTLTGVPVTDGETAYESVLNYDLTGLVNSLSEDETEDTMLSFSLMHTEQLGQPEYNGLYSGNNVKIYSRHVEDESLRPQLILTTADVRQTEEVIVSTCEGRAPVLPENVTVQIEEQETELPVVWEEIPEELYAEPGSFEVMGTVSYNGGETTVKLTVKVETGYSLTVEGGTGSGKYLAGEEVRISAEIPEGYAFVGWDAEGTELGEEQKTSETLDIVMPENDVVLKAGFEKENEPGKEPEETPGEDSDGGTPGAGKEPEDGNNPGLGDAGDTQQSDGNVESTENETAVRTGDDSSIAAWLILMLCASGIISFIVFKMKQNKMK